MPLWTKTRVPLEQTFKNNATLRHVLLVKRYIFYLSLCEKVCHERSFYRVLDVGVVKDDERALASQFESDGSEIGKGMRTCVYMELRLQAFHLELRLQLVFLAMELCLQNCVYTYFLPGIVCTT